ncbi:MAG: GNAT family N-acetyltransferase [Chitinophagaceae bacterium]
MEIITATKKDIPLIQELAKKSWDAAYAHLLSRGQIDYMLSEMYSEKEIATHLDHPDWQYWLVKDNDGNYGGLVGYQWDYEPATTKLHRIYMLPETKGKGLGKYALGTLKRRVKDRNNTRIILNVNKYNTAKAFYESQGFSVYDEGVFDIGNGYVMDDYLMEWRME